MQKGQFSGFFSKLDEVTERYVEQLASCCCVDTLGLLGDK